jgi:hypothetical protein
MALTKQPKLTEAQLNAPDLDDQGRLDVEHYPIPDAAEAGMEDPYLASVWDGALKRLDEGGFGQDDEEEEQGEPAGKVAKDWITTESGTHLFLDGDKVTAGPAALVGKPMNNLNGGKKPKTGKPESKLPKEKPAEVKPVAPSGSGKRMTVADVKQHYGDWYKKQTPASKKLMDKYTQDSTTINSYQRFPDRPWYRPDDPEFTENLDKRIKQLKGLIDSAPPLKEPVTVYRAIGASNEEMKKLIDSLKPGTVHQDNGFVSTTPAEKATGLHGIGKHGNVVMHINVPAGAKAAFLGNSYDEMLLPPGTRFKITGRKGNVVEAEVVHE